MTSSKSSDLQSKKLEHKNRKTKHKKNGNYTRVSLPSKLSKLSTITSTRYIVDETMEERLNQVLSHVLVKED